MVKVDIKELVELKEQGKSYKEIAEYYKKQGIQISTMTISRKLKEYYQSQDKKIPRKKREKECEKKVSTEELILLKEQGKSYKEIAEHYKLQEIKISTASVMRILKPYYEGQSKEIPLVQKSRKVRDRVSTEELISLKELGMSNVKISQYYKTKGILISQTTVGIIIREQYEKEGRKVSKVREKCNIPIEELVELKEQGKSYTEISQYYKTKGIQISAKTIGRRLRVHYDLEGKNVPRKKLTGQLIINIPVEELVELREQGLSYERISKYYTEQGKKVCSATVASRVKDYYRTQGKEIPKIRILRELRVDIPIEELVKLKEQGLSYEKMSKYYTEQGKKISLSTVVSKLKEYYKSKGKEAPKSNVIINIPIEELVELKEQGKNYAEISQYYKIKGIQISAGTIGKRLRGYYISEGKKVPLGKRKEKLTVNVPIEELVELKEQGLSYVRISKYYKLQEIQISPTTIERKIKGYYQDKGEKIPKTKKIKKTRINIPIEQLVQLKEQGNSYAKISKYYELQGIKISIGAIAKRVKDYYESEGKEVPKSKKTIDISVAELVELKEQGKSYEEISEFYKEKGINISRATVGDRLKNYYESQGKKVPRGKEVEEISIEKLVGLKEQGNSYAKISQYYESQGIQISSAAIGKRLKAYYESQGKEVPKGKKENKPRINIPIDDLVKLKEQGMSSKKISQYYKSQGIQISAITVGKRIRSHYKAEGKEVPHSRVIFNIPIEELVELKEQGKSYMEISQYYETKGMQISINTIGRILRLQYDLQGKKVPRGKKTGKTQIEIPIEELVKLKEQGNSYAKISQYYESQGIQISTAEIGKRLKDYYQSKGKKVPRGKTIGRPRNSVPIEELVRLKEQGMSNERISEYCKLHEMRIGAVTVGKRLKAHYESKGEKVPRSRSYDIDKVNAEELIRLRDKGKTLQEISGYYKRKGIKISSQAISKRIKEHKLAKAKEKREKLDAELKAIMLNGESVRVYCQKNKCPEKEEQLKERIRRLKIIASKARKQGEIYIEDKEFLEVLTILDNSMMLYPANKYSVYINPYITNGTCRNGNIDLIQMRVFKRNKDLMCYILSAFKFRYGEEYDKKVWERLKQEHEAKIDKYMGRLHAIEEKRSSTIRKKSKNAKGYQDDDDQR